MLEHHRSAIICPGSIGVSANGNHNGIYRPRRIANACLELIGAYDPLPLHKRAFFLEDLPILGQRTVK